MQFIINRRLKNLIKKNQDCGFLGSLNDHILTEGLPKFKSTEKFFFTDVVMAYREQFDNGAKIDGLSDLLESMANLGGEQVRIHNFIIDQDGWSLVTSADLKILYGVLIARFDNQDSVRDQKRSKNEHDNRARLTKNYKLKTFKEGQIGMCFAQMINLFSSDAVEAKVAFKSIYSSDHPGGREQSCDREALNHVTALGKEPVAVEMRFKVYDQENYVRVSGSGNRISVVVHAYSEKDLEKMFEECERVLQLTKSEFEF